MSATVRDISEKKLVAVAHYLDGFPQLAPGQKEEDVEQYYSLLCAELRRLPPPLGAKFTYTRSQLTEYGMATLRDESPSLLLLTDLQRRGLPLKEFISCLEKIDCQRAINEFLSATRPEITQQSQSQSVLEGKELRLECRARCKPGQPSFFWFRRNDHQSDWEPVIDSHSNILVIQDVNVAHRGDYICRATNPNINDPQRANVFSGEVTVKVEPRIFQQKTPIRQETAGDLSDPPPFPPVITSQPKSLEVEYGQPALLECRANGTDITYDWFRDDQYVGSRSSSGRIEFRHVRLAGQYQCKMTNPQGGFVMSDAVSLTVVPVFVIDQQPPKSLLGYKDEPVSLQCRASSKRGPVTYQWFRNKKSINGATESVYCTKSSGRFCCQVGLREHPEQLPMLSSTTRVSIYTIKITVQPHDVHGQTGECVSLYCRADFIQPVSSKKKIGYMWLMSSTKDGKKEPVQKALQPQQSEGMLLFEQLNINHRGYYVCQACLENEFVESEEVHLSVTMAGDTFPPQVTILRHPVSWVVKPGEGFKMRCRAKVIPDQPLLYQWMKDNKHIPNATAPELIEESGRGSATYHCEVSAGGGVQVHSRSAYTHEPAPDPPPTKGHRNHQQAEAEEMLSTLSGQRYARDKVALLIGNQRYSGCDKLNNLKCIEQEIRSVAEKLRLLDFKVFVFVNLKLLEMKQVLDWFYSLLSPGVHGLFYYSGHGFHVGTTSYLMPVDRQASGPDTNSCIGTNSISHDMQKTLCRAVLVLDCCRVIQEDTSNQATTPYPSLGTANIVEIHSTSLGKAAYDGSAFTQSFIEALDTNKDVSTLCADILHRVREKGEKSTPWMNGSMLGSISLRDPIMRDGVKAEEKAERVWDCADAIHSVCEPVVLEGRSGLAKLLSLRLIFTAPFTNVLSLRVEANLKRIGITASIKVKSQGAEWEEGDTQDNSLSQSITVRNLQRLTKPLCVSVSVTVSVPDSEDVREEMTHTFSGPLLSHLLTPIS